MTSLRGNSTGKQALVTGAASGIGQAIAKRLVAEGVQVVALDRQPIEKNDSIVSYVCDLADSRQVQDTMAEISARFPRIDYGVLAAGMLVFRPAVELSAEDIQQSVACNFTGHSLILSRLGERMASQGGGSIVVIGSNADVAPRIGMAAYGASKAALTLFAQSLGLELAERGVRINILAPGTTRTPMLTGMTSGDSWEQDIIAGDTPNYKLGIPLKRIAEPSDIADTALFLLSDQSRHITMQKIVVDGGATLGR